jgi:hypothetical protein
MDDEAARAAVPLPELPEMTLRLSLIALAALLLFTAMASVSAKVPAVGDVAPVLVPAVESAPVARRANPPSDA